MQVFRLNLGEQGLFILFRLQRRSKTDSMPTNALRNEFFKPRERTRHNKQDVRRVDLQELLVRVLAAALRRYGRDRSFQNLEKGLLNSFPGHVTSN